MKESEFFLHVPKEIPMAERAGFEPAVPCGTPDFESGTFDHSATSPRMSLIMQISVGRAIL